MQLFIVTRTARRYWLVKADASGVWVEYTEISRTAAKLLKQGAGLEIFRDRGMPDPD